MLIPKLYEDMSVLHQNTVPVHTYFIPVSHFHKAWAGRPPREDSDRICMLSGCPWEFSYFSSIHELGEKFFKPDYAPGRGWTKERVPFAWQMRGYDYHQYTNIRYPFPFDPPYVPRHNPCGAYRRRFSWHRDPAAPRTFLHFEGVDSCFYVWLNGHYVGYSQVTHHTSEFEVTEYLAEGENLLAVLVLKWCDGSYLEDQDKFRMSGIIRDVYLLNRPARHIEDYRIQTDLSADREEGILSVSLRFSGEAVPVRARLLDSLGREIAAASSSDRDDACLDRHAGQICKISMRLVHPLLWTAETPDLYTLVMETEEEAVIERVGFRTVAVDRGVVCLNGVPIKFRGVNRHESDPVTGPVVTREQAEKDLRMIKDHNFNAVRASHYPNVPWFYQLCDELGLYVIDEADNESHGTSALYFTEEDYVARMRLAHERIADHPDFIRPSLDRVRSMVLRNRNRPCILIWSMGNECGYGSTFEAALRWTKETDPTRLTHYESAFYLPHDRADVSDIDLVGRMYPAFSEIRDYFAQDPEKPLLLVEYCHSMGNSPGDIQEYRDLTERYPGLCGGFVWEWCDHAIYKGQAQDGRAMYWYGGDHGEEQHDGNFCLDGLVGPDRKPHAGLLEYKNVHRPLRAAWDPDEKKLTIENHWDFLEASACAEARYCLTLDGEIIQEGEIRLPDLPPHESAALPFSPDIPDAGRCFLKITYRMKIDAAGMAVGHDLGFDEIRVRTGDERNRRAAALLEGPAIGYSEVLAEGAGKEDCCGLQVSEEGTDLRVTGNGFSYVLDTLTGRFTSLTAGGKEFLDQPVDFNLWRAPTDNDREAAVLWRGERLDKTVTRAYETIILRAGAAEGAVGTGFRAGTAEDAAGTGFRAGAVEDAAGTGFRAEPDGTDREDKNCAVVIAVKQSVAAMSVQPILRINAVYTIRPDGAIRMDIRADKDPEIETLPRLGLRFFLPVALDRADYYGMGPGESYIDKCRGSSHGYFQAAVSELMEDYIRPQENGSHFDCDYVRLTGGGMALTAVSADRSTFSFNASFYTQEELEQKAHNYELEKCGHTVLCLDHRMAGIGSNSCGPSLSEEYRVDEASCHFAFMIKPSAGQETDM